GWASGRILSIVMDSPVGIRGCGVLFADSTKPDGILVIPKSWKLVLRLPRVYVACSVQSQGHGVSITSYYQVLGHKCECATGDTRIGSAKSERNKTRKWVGSPRLRVPCGAPCRDLFIPKNHRFVDRKKSTVNFSKRPESVS